MLAANYFTTLAFLRWACGRDTAEELLVVPLPLLQTRTFLSMALLSLGGFIIVAVEMPVPGALQRGRAHDHDALLSI